MVIWPSYGGGKIGLARPARRVLPRFVKEKMVGGEEKKWRGGAKLEWPGPARLRSAQLGSASKVGIWCRRDALFAKKVPFAVDETTLDFPNVHLV